MTCQEFTVKLIKDDKTSGAGFKVPLDVQAVFGKKSQIKVRGTIDGYPYRGSIHPYGGIHYMGVRKDIRDAIGKNLGDFVHVVMDIDDELRVVEIPGDLKQALEDNDVARLAFEKYSYSHKKEHADWINGAKKPGTRKRRIEKAIEILAERKVG
ncbi:MAG TPA: YdeI/OmpD-associated family protein [Methanocellaceae archaeon]